MLFNKSLLNIIYLLWKWKGRPISQSFLSLVGHLQGRAESIVTERREEGQEKKSDRVETDLKQRTEMPTTSYHLFILAEIL